MKNNSSKDELSLLFFLMFSKINTSADDQRKAVENYKN
jgi:hypothetical protein